MPHFEPINATRCKNHGWRPNKSYLFAEQDSIVPIVADEVPHVLAQLPMAFRKMSDKGGYELAAVLSLEKNLNLLVHPDGTWMGSYIPAVYRAYPFRSVAEKDTGRMVLCFDMDSGLYREEPGPEDRLFYDEKGQMAPAFSRVADFMEKYENQRRVTLHIAGVLAQQGLIVPWEIKVQDQNGNPLPVKGLNKIDEKALRELPAEKLDTLRKAGALPVAYAQLFSQHRMSNIAKLYNIHRNLTEKTPEIDIEKFFGEEDVFRFDH